MKAIMISIKPKYVADILNGKKTIEIRKTIPQEYLDYCIDSDKKVPIEVYIYCTKEKPFITGIYNHEHKIVYGDIENKKRNVNGKVVAKFTLNNVEDFYNLDNISLAMACLTKEELNNYLKGKIGYAWHIDNLEIFDKPKELSEFNKPLDNFDGINCWRCRYVKKCSFNCDKKCELLKITKAPQSWCYVEKEM